MQKLLHVTLISLLIAFAFTFAGCKSDPIVYELTVNDVSNSEYGYIYHVAESENIMMLVASGEYDLWHGNATTQSAYVTVNPSAVSEDVAKFFQEGTGAVISHYLIVTEGSKSIIYEITDVEWTNSEELDAGENALSKDFDGETIVEVNELDIDGKILKYPAVLGELSISDVRTPALSDDYVYGSFPYRNTEDIDWFFFHSMGNPYFAFSIPSRNHGTVYILEDQKVTPIFKLIDDENWFSFFRESAAVENSVGEDQVVTYLYHFPGDLNGQPIEVYMPHLKQFMMVNPNSENILSCYANIEISDEEYSSIMEFTNKEDCDFEPGLYIDGEKMAESFVGPDEDSPYLRENYISPNMESLAFILQFSGGTDYMIDWHWRSGEWTVFEISYSDPEQDTWDFLFPFTWQKNANGSYEIKKEQDEYQLKVLQ